jgi:CRISPR-associated endonuclease/helicase Cas3
MPTFQNLTGHPAFPWQSRLLDEFSSGRFPASCDIPTGLGKTSVIALWLLALAEAPASVRIPRRLVYIVDRRVVVDQASEEVEELNRRLSVALGDNASPLHPLATALRSLSVSGDKCLAISTLRGQMADNQDWLQDPAQPTVIVGTVDMIGSRLLFSPYGRVGKSRRAMHAGLMAQDSLIVIDEAHLCPSFVQTLRSIREHTRTLPSVVPFHLMELSATQLATSPEVFRLEQQHNDFADSRVTQRIDAPKQLRIMGAPREDPAKPPKAKAVAQAIATEAVRLAGSSFSVATFVNTVAMVNEVRALLPEEQTVVLTGEMRGAERDVLVSSGRLSAFLPRSKRTEQAKPAFLIATACAEVGINFDADHAVCDVVALERMIQRFGRVNRYGLGQAEITIIDTTTEEQLQARATLAVLRSLRPAGEGYDASPAALQMLDKASTDCTAAWTPSPPCPALERARLDDWSMTSCDSHTKASKSKPDSTVADQANVTFARPQVTYWLRGLVANDADSVAFVWRTDFAQAFDETDAIQAAEAIPSRPQEIAPIAQHRVASFLRVLVDAAPSAGWLVHISAADETRARRLSDLATDQRFLDSITDGTVFLPTAAGGLNPHGLPDADSRVPVSDEVDTDQWLRLIHKSNGDGQSLMPTAAAQTDEPDLIDPDVSLSQAIRQLHGPGWRMEAAFPPDTDADGLDEAPAFTRWLYLHKPQSRFLESRTSAREITVDEHNADAARFATLLCEKLRLPPDITESVVLAAQYHDEGKRRRAWQRGIGNHDSGKQLAKSLNTGFNNVETEGYRHEFGSLVDLTKKNGSLVGKLTDHPQQDLILHLVAAHHGWARPHFPQRAFDPEHLADSPATAHEAALRFARLQTRFGWWQLAYLESLVKAADAMASRHAETSTR